MSCPDCEQQAQKLSQYKSAIESWKKDEVIWKQTERGLLLQAQQMQAGAEELLEELSQLRAERDALRLALEQIISHSEDLNPGFMDTIERIARAALTQSPEPSKEPAE